MPLPGSTITARATPGVLEAEEIALHMLRGAAPIESELGHDHEPHAATGADWHLRQLAVRG
jgi:hypothetical protein